MENFVFIIFLLLCIGLFLSAVRKGRSFFKPRFIRFLIIIVAAAFYTIWFVRKSADRFAQDALTLQLISKLPQPVDFFVIAVNSGKNAPEKYFLKHAGKIRPDHYRIEYLNMEHSNEYWIAGYIGKKNLVYFSQHAVPNKNMDQIVEVNNYINQSARLSANASSQIETHLDENISHAVWISLGLLLLFLNIVLLIRKK